MNVRKEESPTDPVYPDAKEFLKNRAALGAAILGAGMALGGCADKGRTGGVVAVPDGAKEAWAGNPKTWKGGEDEKPMRLGGDIAVEPKGDPPRVLEKSGIEIPSEPPRLPGAPPAMSSKPEY